MLLTTYKTKFLAKAIELALQSSLQQKHGAILFTGNKIICGGTNSSNRTCFNGRIMPSIHAEMDCMMKDGNKKWGFKLYQEEEVWKKK